MDEVVGVSSAIAGILKSNPRGLTVTDLSKKLRLNRNSTAKHLGILAAEGKVEVRIIGSAKVYSLSLRVPLSAFLCFTKNMILILDGDRNIVQVNDQFLKLAGCTKQELLGRNLSAVGVPALASPEALRLIGLAEREQVTTDIRFNRGNDDFFYRMDVIPTTFEGGEKGLTVVLEDITERKRYVQDMEFLTRTAMDLIDMPPGIDIYQYIAERIVELVPCALVFVDSYEEKSRQFIMKAIMDRRFREGLQHLVGRDVVGMAFRVDDLSGAPHYETVSSAFMTREHVFGVDAGAGDWSFYDLCFRQIPEPVCEEIRSRFNIGKLFGISIVWQEHLFGVVGIFLPPDRDFQDRQAIESFVRQASIAIARRHTEESLRRSERRLSDIVNLVQAPAAIVDPDGRYLHVNRGFTDLLGYTLSDIPNGKTWFIRAFPDPVRRKEAIAAWKEDLGRIRAGEATSRTFEVQCKSGERKPIGFSPVVLSDGTQFIRFADCTPAQ